MTGKTHMICSTAAVVALTAVKGGHFDLFGTYIPLYVSIVPAAVGAWLPDMDIPQSRLGSKLGFLSKSMKHRGITHTLLMPAVLFTIASTMNNALTALIVIVATAWLTSMIYGKKKGFIVAGVLLVTNMVLPSVGAAVAFGVGLGWLLHIIEDLFNSKGCPIFWPLQKKRWAIPIIGVIKTRHWSEYVFMLAWLGGCGAWVFLSQVGAYVTDLLHTLR